MRSTRVAVHVGLPFAQDAQAADENCHLRRGQRLGLGSRAEQGGEIVEALNVAVGKAEDGRDSEPAGQARRTVQSFAYELMARTGRVTVSEPPPQIGRYVIL